LDRSLAASIARTGGRLAAVLLPLAAFTVLRIVGMPRVESLPEWLAPGIAGLGSMTAGGALLLVVAAYLERGRMRDLGDAAGLGLLAATLAGLAAAAMHPLGLGIGLAAAAAGLGVGSALAGRRLNGRRRRWIGVVIVVLVVDAGLASALFGGAVAGGTEVGPLLLAGGALLLAVAAAVTWREGARATALGIAAASFAALALAGASDAARLPGLGGLAVATASMGWVMALRRLQPGSTAGSTTSTTRTSTTLPEVRARLQMPLDWVAEPEFDEGARLTRELRATLDDLVAARRTIGLQRTEIERAASVDPLTGLVSRGPTLDRLRMEAAEARRYAHPVAVVLLDVDGFARLNHEHGLQVGDAILREVALRLRLRIREADALGRVGGDAFLAILPHTDEGGAATFARAVLDRLLARSFTTDRGEMTVSLSIGIALMRPGMTFSGEELLAAAEEALASAKAAGGNRIAFDRLHGLARLDERRAARQTPDDAEPTPKDERRDAR
jgi:diguanylate cyclase (GGDEF)-like protein